MIWLLFINRADINNCKMFFVGADGGNPAAGSIALAGNITNTVSFRIGAECRIIVDLFQLASEYFYFIIIKGIKNTPHLQRLVLTVNIVFL